jgi:ABC-2 type transport system permease protein
MTPAFMVRVPKSSGWGLFTKTVYARAYPRLVGALREKSWIFFEILLPLLAVSAYVFIYRALQAPEQYIGFVVVGGAMTAFWMNILWSMSSQLYWEKEMGNLALYIMAPNSMMAILLGMAVGGLVMTLTRAVVILGLGSWLFNVEYSVSSYWQLALVFALTMVSLYGMGMMSASVYLLLSREAWHISNLAQEPVFLVSGFYFPVKNLGFWIPLLASIIPLTLGLDAVRQLAIPGGSDSGFLPVPVEAAILLFLSIIFLAGARWLLAYMERLAIREGRLTESRR